MSAFHATFRPALEKLIELAALRAGESALHLGCGAGMLALLVAARLGPRGSVVGVDNDVAAARANANALGASTVTFEPREGGALHARPRGFDVVFCAPGAIAEARPLVKRGGRLAVFGLGAASENRFVTEAAAALGVDPLTVDFADGPEVERRLVRAGLVTPRALSIGADLVIRSAEAWWRIAADAAGWANAGPEGVAPLEWAHAALAPGPDRPARLSCSIILARAADDPRPAKRATPPLHLDALARAVAASVRRLPPAEARGWLARATALDVREPEERAAGSLPGDVHVPRGLLEGQAAEKLPDRAAPILVYCNDGARAALAAATLSDLGYEDVQSLEGGLDAWRASEGAG